MLLALLLVALLVTAEGFAPKSAESEAPNEIPIVDISARASTNSTERQELGRRLADIRYLPCWNEASAALRLPRQAFSLLSFPSAEKRSKIHLKANLQLAPKRHARDQEALRTRHRRWDKWKSRG